jgi:hypothetical protein
LKSQTHCLRHSLEKRSGIRPNAASLFGSILFA